MRVLGAAGLLLVAVWAGAQQITAYGYDPDARAGAFYLGDRRIGGADTLARLHLDRGGADSVFYYAEQYRREAVALPDAVARRTGEVEALYWLGCASTDKGLYEAALQRHVRGLRAFGEGEDSVLYWAHYVERARVNGVLGRDERAVAGFAEAEAALRQNPRYGARLSTRLYLAKAAFYLRSDSTALAETALADAGRALKRQPDAFLAGELAYLSALGSRSRGDEAGAREQLLPLLTSTRTSGDYGLYRTIVLELGRSYVASDDLDAASMTLSAALANAYQWDDLELQRAVLDELRRLEAGRGRTANAYALMTQKDAVERRLRGEQDAELARRLEVEFQTLEKQREIDGLEGEAERRRTRQRYLLVGFLAFLVPVLAFLYTFYQKLRREGELDVARAAVDAQEAERARIGRQLHDTVGGNLAAMRLQLSRATGVGADSVTGMGTETGAGAAPMTATTTATALINALDETYGMVRDLSHDLVPVRLREGGLDAAVRDYLARVGAGGAPTFEYVAHPPACVDRLPARTQAELFAIVQELVTNTLKHADAEHAELSVTLTDATVRLMYADDGRGFVDGRATEGLGLRNLRTRAAGLGARLAVDAVPGRGSTFALEIPVP